jgi:acyl-CoA thioester hydrolase
MKDTSAAWSETELRVRYAETDKMGVVYYANYLVWMEIARTDFCLHAGFRYRDLENRHGVMIAVAEARCRYRRPARYDDTVRIRTRLVRLKRRSMTFEYEVSSAIDGTLLADGSTTHVSVNAAGRPTSIPQEQFRMLEGKLTTAPPASA